MRKREYICASALAAKIILCVWTAVICGHRRPTATIQKRARLLIHHHDCRPIHKTGPGSAVEHLRSVDVTQEFLGNQANKYGPHKTTVFPDIKKKPFTFKFFRVYVIGSRIPMCKALHTNHRPTDVYNDTTRQWLLRYVAMITIISGTGTITILHSSTSTTSRNTLLQTVVHLMLCSIG